MARSQRVEESWLGSRRRIALTALSLMQSLSTLVPLFTRYSQVQGLHKVPAISV